MDFIVENDLELNTTAATYINPAGSEISTLDYFIMDKRISKDTYAVVRLENVVANVSDHLPVKCDLDFKEPKIKPTETRNLQHTSKVKWQKVDKQMYSQQVEEQISMINGGKNSTNDIQATVQQLHNIVVKSAIKAAPEKKIRRHRKAKLAVYTPIIKNAIQNKERLSGNGKMEGDPKRAHIPC